MRFLLADAGNSSTELSWYTQSAEAHHCTLQDSQNSKIPNFPNSIKIPTEHAIEQISTELSAQSATLILCSVVPELSQSLTQHLGTAIHHVDHHSIPQLRIASTEPEQIGADRLVSALAAWKDHQCPCLIVDSGTAITWCWVTEHGEFKGGNIFPGMGIASKALNDYTAKVPHISVKPRAELYGTSTQDAVEIGLYRGYYHLINGLISDYKAEIPGLKVIGTGSGLEVLDQTLDLDILDPKLMIKGLAICAEDLSSR